ncbi:hypothetical protein [Arthrobacter sp. B0490]|uniref:hypothetical protein n=1 Tax=Arthrobacter sp. B0490 TaxID=2058891 RepID=UPI000CE2D40E|nr:hypothetical protein [Arthrobacter sp. B0490]
MIDSIHLTLLAGRDLPVPLPAEVIQAVKAIQVTTSAGERSGFQITVATSRRSVVTTQLVPAGALDPGIRIVIVVTVSGLPTVLMDGVITRQEAGFSSELGQSTLTLTGEDLTVLMETEDRRGRPFPPMPAVGVVGWLLKDYARYGIIPVLVPEVFSDVPNPIDHTRGQEGSDLEMIRKLAKDNGYVFYLDPGPLPGSSRAYWGPEIRIGVPQPALNVDMEGTTNVEALSFSFDGLQRTQVTVTIQEPRTRITVSVPVPDISILAPPLAARQAPSMRTKPLEGAAKLSPISAMAKGLAAVAESADAVTGSGQLNVLRYGRVLLPRRLVGVRGTGPAYDGLYYVKSVTHNLKPGEYTQNFSLSRNGLVPLVPMVVP